MDDAICTIILALYMMMELDNNYDNDGNDNGVWWSMVMMQLYDNGNDDGV